MRNLYQFVKVSDNAVALIDASLGRATMLAKANTPIPIIAIGRIFLIIPTTITLAHVLCIDKLLPFTRWTV